MSKLNPNDIKGFKPGEKEEILMNALDKTVGLFIMEYNLSYPAVIGCLEILKDEARKNYYR